MDRYDHTIIGGGVAGLATAIRLAELGAKPLLIEASRFPTQKVCGEFLSGEVLPTLARWGIFPSSRIQELKVGDHHFTLPTPGGALSRDQLDAALLEVARGVGAEVRTETHVSQIEPGFSLTLSTGERVATRLLFVGSGRVLGTPSFPYVGYKAHATDLDIKTDLEMIAEPGRYTGISHLGEGIYNVATIARAGVGPYPLDLDWMEVKVPQFGIRKTPRWADAFFIGDAAGSIAPLCGGGLSMGIGSGILAAEHAINGDWRSYRKAWSRKYRRPLRIGSLLHRFALHRLAPPKGILPLLYQLTR